MISVLCVIGTRPEAIKMAHVVRALQRQPGRFRVATLSTGQHRHMLDQVLDTFGLSPEVDLAVMQEGQTPTAVAARVLAALEPVLAQHRPDWVLVQGDTTTVLAAALAAHYQRVRIGHVEAGLRSYDRQNPFPEETNRVLTDHLSDLCFAPTERARQNLLREGIPDHRIRVTGNTVVDALLWAREQPLTAQAAALLGEMAGGAQQLVLVTAHRRESFGEPLERICRALGEIARRGGSRVRVLYPVHPNPNVRGPVRALLADVPGISLVEPLDYLTLVQVMARASVILTDSGGIQEEAPTLGVPVLVLREITERPEAVEAGTAQIVGTDPERIVGETFRALERVGKGERRAPGHNPYGDGHAGERIVDALAECASDGRFRPSVV